MSDQEPAKCEECGKTLKVGERVASVRVVGAGARRYWHPACLDISEAPLPPPAPINKWCFG